MPKARILYLHGFSEYIDSYDGWFAFFTASGYEVTSYDQRGFGLTARSKKDFGESDTRLIFSDLETMVEYVSQGYIGPLVLYGFSMGAANVLNYMVSGIKRGRFDLYISTSPYIRTAPESEKGLNCIKLLFVPVAAKIIPNVASTAVLKPEQLTNDTSQWKQVAHNPLRPFRSSAIFMYDAIQRGALLLHPVFIKSIVDRPLLLSQGLADTVCDPDATKRYFYMVPLSEKTLYLYKGLPHALMICMDQHKLRYWGRIRDWLDVQVTRLPNRVF